MKARRIAWSIVGLLSLCAATRALEPIAILSPSDVPAGYTNGFGSSVAISGDYLVIGAPLDPWYSGSATGAAYVFRRQGPTWIEQGKLTAADPAGLAQLGWSVAIDGDVVVAGAPKLFPAQECGYPQQGAAYIFRRNDQGTPDDPTDDTWPQESKLTVAPPLSNERLGMSVAVSDDVIVVGGECRNTAEVFRWNPGAPPSWTHEASLTGSQMKGRYAAGVSVDADAGRVVVGAHYGWGEGPGAAYVFVRDGMTWVEEVALSPTDHPSLGSFGSDVSVSADRVGAGAPGIDSAYVFVRAVDGRWAEEARLTASGGVVREFGYSLAIDGDLLLVGRPGDPFVEPQDSLAYLFRHETDGWTESDRLDPSWPIARSVAIDGNFAAVDQQVYAVRDRRNIRDFAAFQNCFTGSIGAALSATCQAFDLTGDGRVDLADFEKFVGTFVGPQNAGARS